MDTDSFLVGSVRNEESIRLLLKYIPKYPSPEEMVALLNRKNKLYLTVVRDDSDDENADSPDSITEEIISSRIRHTVKQFLDRRSAPGTSNPSTNQEMLLMKDLLKSLKVCDDSDFDNSSDSPPSSPPNLRGKMSSKQLEPSTSGSVSMNPSGGGPSGVLEADRSESVTSPDSSGVSPIQTEPDLDQIRPASVRSFTSSDEDDLSPRLGRREIPEAAVNAPEAWPPVAASYSPYLRPSVNPLLGDRLPEVPLQRPIPVSQCSFFSQVVPESSSPTYYDTIAEGGPEYVNYLNDLPIVDTRSYMTQLQSFVPPENLPTVQPAPVEDNENEAVLSLEELQRQEEQQRQDELHIAQQLIQPGIVYLQLQQRARREPEPITTVHHVPPPYRLPVDESQTRMFQVTPSTDSDSSELYTHGSSSGSSRKVDLSQGSPGIDVEPNNQVSKEETTPKGKLTKGKQVKGIKRQNEATEGERDISESQPKDNKDNSAKATKGGKKSVQESKTSAPKDDKSKKEDGSEDNACALEQSGSSGEQSKKGKGIEGKPTVKKRSTKSSQVETQKSEQDNLRRGSVGSGSNRSRPGGKARK